MISGRRLIALTAIIIFVFAPDRTVSYRSAYCALRFKNAAGLVTVQSIHKGLLDVGQERGLVVLDAEKEVAAAVDDLGSDGLLATHGVDADEGATYVKLTEPGPLLLQGDHGKVSYRNIRIRPLTK